MPVTPLATAGLLVEVLALEQVQDRDTDLAAGLWLVVPYPDPYWRPRLVSAERPAGVSEAGRSARRDGQDLQRLRVDEATPALASLR